MPKRKHNLQGQGPAWDWIKGAARSVHSFVKDKRLVSKGLNALASSGLTPYSAGLSRASNVANKLGYGVHHKRKTRKKGGAKTRKSKTVGAKKRKTKKSKTHKR